MCRYTLLLTQIKAARFLGVSPRTLRRWTAAGVVRAVVVAGRVRYRPADLLSLARNGGNQGAP